MRENPDRFTIPDQFPQVSEPRNRPAFFKRWLRLLVPTVILVPSMVGFGMKFIEFLAVYRGDAQGAFAVAPILNYLLASAGFLLLFGWAAANGMFHDIEKPKHTMLENEARLDHSFVTVPTLRKPPQ